MTEDREPARARATAEGAAVEETPPPLAKRPRRKGFLVAAAFLAPALILLGALVLYPIIFSVVRSLYDKVGDTFVGADNYTEVFTDDRTLTAIKNTVIWVVFAPAIVTALGLVFAVLTERVRWSTAFKVAVFMPMAVSFLSAGVIWRVVYEKEPERGLANAATRGVVDTFRSPGDYPGAEPSDTQLLALVEDGGGLVTKRTFAPGEMANLGLLKIRPELVPEEATIASPPSAAGNGIAGVVWLDFTRGGGGDRGVIDPTESGLPGIKVEALSGDEMAATAVTESDGSYVLDGLPPGDYSIRLAESNFREPFGGVSWLGPALVTPAIIVSYIWIWAGFAMVVIGAGLAAIPRDVLEAARVDGANEWQVFRRVTVPLLMPVLAVVFVTLIINVLKIFDIVLVTAPGAVQDDASVVALEMWRRSFGGAQDQGLGSTLAVFLFVLIIPFMWVNIRRFRAEQQ